MVELGDHHATILDGDTFEPIHRFATRFALHGGPKFSPDGRFVCFASRDGWISKFDIYNLKTVAEIRAGINTHNLAVSFDGRYAMVANYLPHSLVLLDTDTMKPPKCTHRWPRQCSLYSASPPELHRRAQRQPDNPGDTLSGALYSKTLPFLPPIWMISFSIRITGI